MQVTTGKVNQLGLEKSYFDGAVDEESSNRDNRQNRNHNRKKNRNNRDRNRDHFNNAKQKSSFLGRLFSFGGK